MKNGCPDAGSNWSLLVNFCFYKFLDGFFSEETTTSKKEQEPEVPIAAEAKKRKRLIRNSTRQTAQN